MPPISPTDLARAFDTHAPALLLYAKHFVGPSLAEDLLQDVFLRLAAQPHAPDNPRAWLLASIKNAALDALKSSRRRKARDTAAAIDRAALFAPAPDENMGHEDLAAALAGLPELHREILTLRLWTGATFPEIAALTGTPISTAFAHYQAALKTLKTRWESPCKTK